MDAEDRRELREAPKRRLHPDGPSSAIYLEWLRGGGPPRVAAEQMTVYDVLEGNDGPKDTAAQAGRRASKAA